MAEDRLRQETTEPVWKRLRWGAVLGGEAFADALRKGMRIARETTGRRSLRAEASWPAVVLAVERVKGEPWSEFRDRYGDWGRDLTLWVARRHAGMTLRELGEAVSGMDYSAVSEAVHHFQRRWLPRAEVRSALREVLRYLNLDSAEKPIRNAIYNDFQGIKTQGPIGDRAAQGILANITNLELCDIRVFQRNRIWRRDPCSSRTDKKDIFMKSILQMLMLICVTVSYSSAEESKSRNVPLPISFRVIPYDGYYFLCRGTALTDKIVRLANAEILFSNSNSLSFALMHKNRPNMMNLGVIAADGADAIYLQISPKQSYYRYVSQQDRNDWFDSNMNGYMQIEWNYWGYAPPIYVGFPDENGNIAPPVVDRPLRYHTRKHQIALAFIFHDDKPRELGFLVMNKLDEPFTAVEPLSARSRIIATAPAISYRRELFFPDKKIMEMSVPSGEVREWRLPWRSIMEMIPKEDIEKIIAAGGDLDLIWKLDDEESPILPMHIAPPETFRNSRIVPHPEMENVVIIAEPDR